MTTKTFKQNPSPHLYKKPTSKYSKNLVYGKPSKPRCLEPSMFQILSWKQDNQQQKQSGQNNQQSNDMDNHNQELISLKKITHCKSLPSQQFERYKSQHNLPQKNHKQLKSNLKDNNEFILKEEFGQSKKKVKLSDISEYLDTQNTQKQLNSVKKLINSTRNIQSQNKIKANNDQNENFMKIRQKNTFNKENNRKNKQIKQTKQVKQTKQTKQKLQKKGLQFYSNPQKKPRYMQEKKTAIQKLIQSQNFDQQLFQRKKQEQIKKFKQTSRDLSNTGFLTYFNKPPFQNYGRQNKHAVGVLYGDYMYSHNVYPHTGQNKPKKQQTYVSAISRAKSAGNIRPHPTLTRHLEQSLISGYLTLTDVYPKNTSFDSLQIKNKTVLQQLPQFNLNKKDDRFMPRYSPFINVNPNDEMFSSIQNKYLKKDEIPKFFSNKDEIQGKQITYVKKIQPLKN